MNSCKAQEIFELIQKRGEWRAPFLPCVVSTSRVSGEMEIRDAAMSTTGVVAFFVAPAATSLDEEHARVEYAGVDVSDDDLARFRSQILGGES